MAISGFFSFKVSLYKLREEGCDVEISHPIIILVCLCRGRYYITMIYIYIYQCNIIPAYTQAYQNYNRMGDLHIATLFTQFIQRNLKGKKPDDGHMLFYFQSQNIHLLYKIRVVFLTTLPPIQFAYTTRMTLLKIFQSLTKLQFLVYCII